LCSHICDNVHNEGYSVPTAEQHPRTSTKTALYVC
jgi:hypothetical protein